MKLWVEKGIRKSRNADRISSSMNISDIKAILVIRHAALGDMIQTRPFLHELRKVFPKAHIKMSLISSYQIGAPKDLVDEVEVLPGRDQRDYSFFKLFKHYRSQNKYDLLIDLASTSRSRTQSFLTKATLKLGFPYRDIPFIYHYSLFRSEFRYETELLLEFLNLFGHIPEYPLNFQLPNLALSERENKFGYFPSSSMGIRNYPIDWMQQLIETNAKAYPGMDHYIIQGAQASEGFEDLYEKLKHIPNVKLRLRSNLDELTKWFTTCRYLVANDTGVRHLAMGVGVPTLGFFSWSIPFRNYNPHDVKHICVINPDGSFVKPEIVASKMAQHLKRL